ncbi:MAG: flagellar accessory protein FlaH [Thaumarchaeota archaeon]|nr:flagellar accessory protein FlaH [Nitrososphaerota archaeon]MBI3641149.1 flagellar accessory protein FlaH [Nitrososphaerota archaeon]
MEIISTGNDEVDIQLGGGLPLPSLIVIEGDHGAGKSAVIAQFMKGMLDAELKVLCITENTVNDYIKKMKSITFDFAKPFLENKLTVLSLQINGNKWSKEQSSLVLPTIGKYITENAKKNNCVIIDSLSFLTIHSSTSSILEFITKCKNLVSNGMSIVITMHPDSISQDVGLRLKSVSDGYLLLSSSRVGDKFVKVMKTIKLIGSVTQPEPEFAFDIDPIFGIKIVPISMTSV